MRSLIYLLLVFAMTLAALPAETPPYRMASLPIESRLDDLLGRMTLEEKVGQMCQYVGFDHLRANESVADRIPENDDSTGAYPDLSYNELWRRVRAGEIGSFLLVTEAAEANQIQAAAAESRLGIPILLGIDAIHGHGFGQGATIYPTPLNLAATFDPELVERVAHETAEVLRAEGLHWTFTPNVDVARDPRWGRVGETFGEDPLLVAQLGAATVRGFRAGAVLTCLKHLIAGAEPANGLNAAPMDVSERTLRAVHWPPFEAGVSAGAESVMLAHHALNGMPCHANEALVAELRGRVGFEGFTVSDWTDVSRLATLHRVAADYREAVKLALQGGLDMHMHGPGFFEAVVDLVRSGEVSEARIDESARRLLRAKFQLGLFDRPSGGAVGALPEVQTASHRATALEAARKSIVLLKNEGGVLPMEGSGQARKVLLTGPFADNPAILGDWVLEQAPGTVTTIRQGMAARPEFADLRFVDVGQNPLELDAERIAAAVAAAHDREVIVVAVGESAYRGQAWRTSGENHDRASLSLPGAQEDLLRALKATGKALVVVVVQSRPLAVEWAASQADALVIAGEPGAEGGRAVAEVLAGTVNPSGRLPMSVARSAGHLPVYYNHETASYWRNYAIESTEPLFVFGDGLSYTQFEYEKLTLPTTLRSGEALQGRVVVRNAGDRAGEEVVLVFASDEVSRVATPVRELKAFQRVALEPGETREVEFVVPADALAVLTPRLERVIEPGWFTVKVADQVARVEVVAP